MHYCMSMQTEKQLSAVATSAADADVDLSSVVATVRRGSALVVGILGQVGLLHPAAEQNGPLGNKKPVLSD